MSGFTMHLKRKFNPILVNFFLPLTLLVYISTISFVIPHNMIPGRMSLIMTIFLMIINTANYARSVAPKSSKSTWLGLWLDIIVVAEV